TRRGGPPDVTPAGSASGPPPNAARPASSPSSTAPEFRPTSCRSVATKWPETSRNAGGLTPMDKMLPWKVVWSALGVIVAVSSGLLAALAELDPLLVTAAFLLAGLVCLAMGRKAIDTADVFDGVKTEARDQIKTAVTIAVFANTGLAVFSLVSPDMAALWVAVGVALFAIECGVAKW